ncbi:MAG: hypothetical protein PHV68_03000 [Candidatus Gastranaerophilales bacterium]|nr:hypothetical protein [Candidatus Gastranaerophilales bacterium]
MDKITKIALDLNEQSNNKYQLVYEIVELAKKLIDDSQQKRPQDDYGYDIEPAYNAPIKQEKPVQHAIMVKSSEYDDGGLVG